MNDKPILLDLKIGLNLPKKSITQSLFGEKEELSKPPEIILRKTIPLNDRNRELWEKIILKCMENPLSIFQATVNISFSDPYKALYKLKQAGFLVEEKKE